METSSHLHSPIACLLNNCKHSWSQCMDIIRQGRLCSCCSVEIWIQNELSPSASNVHDHTSSGVWNTASRDTAHVSKLSYGSSRTPTRRSISGWSSYDRDTLSSYWATTSYSSTLRPRQGQRSFPFFSAIGHEYISRIVTVIHAHVPFYICMFSYSRSLLCIYVCFHTHVPFSVCLYMSIQLTCRVLIDEVGVSRGGMLMTWLTMNMARREGKYNIIEIFSGLFYRTSECINYWYEFYGDFRPESSPYNTYRHRNESEVE